MNTTDENTIEANARLWLRQNSLLLQTVTPQASPAVYHGAMKNIAEEGEGLLGNPMLLQPDIRTEISLVSANAAANLVLTETEVEQRTHNIQKCFHLCDQSIAAALQAESSGLVCEAACRTITILIYCKPSVPEEMRLPLESRAKRISEILERYLDFQTIDRQLGTEKLDQGYTLVACLPLVDDPDDRRVVLEEAAVLIKGAGDCFLRAWDFEKVEQVQADLEELKISLQDEALPMPDLAFLETKAESETVLPPTVKTPAESPPAAPAPQTPPGGRRRSPLLWLLSIVGMLASCFSLFSGAIILYSSWQGTSIPDDQNAMQQTQVSLRASMTALVTDVQSGLPPGTQTPATIGSVQGNNIDNPATALPGDLTTSPPQVLLETCPGAPPSQLKLNLQAAVGNVGGYSLAVHSGAGYNAEELYYLEEGAQVNIINGPTCIGNQLWWQISIDQGNIGWAPESSESGEYLLIP